MKTKTLIFVIIAIFFNSGVPNNTNNYGSKIPILNNCCLSEFSKYMNAISRNLSFNFDHAVAIIPPTYYINNEYNKNQSFFIFNK